MAFGSQSNDFAPSANRTWTTQYHCCPFCSIKLRHWRKFVLHIRKKHPLAERLTK